MTKLKFIALSGTTSVTENLYVYEYGNEMMVLDCGVGFPDIEMYGVDLVIPDFSYVINNKKKLRGILLSQGHEDHIGAVPYLLQEVNTKVYCTKMVSEFLKDKLKEFDINNTNIEVFDPKGRSFNIGRFQINPFRVTHSVPDAVGFAIDTPEGKVFHVPEHKMDQNPVDKMPFDIEKAKQLANKEILFLASDCLGSNKPGHTPPETSIEQNLFNIVQQAPNRVFFTAISSNIGRFQQAINVAQKTGRKAVLVGRSVQRKCEVAYNLGYLDYPKGAVIGLKEAIDSSKNKIMIIIAGCYGQIGSSVYRLAENEHERVYAEPGDTFIFSADPAPPYTKESEDYVIDKLIEQNLDVHYYDLKEGLYVSGHGAQEDIIDLFKIVKPKFFMPIGGTIRFMRGYRKLAEKFGAQPENIFELKPGEGVEFQNRQAQRMKKIAVKEVLVDGLGIGDVGRIVLEDRKVLSQHGVAIVLVKIDRLSKKVNADPEIMSRGFVFEREERQFLKESSKTLKSKLNKSKKINLKFAQETAKSYLTDLFYQHTKRRPMIIPVVVEEQKL